MQHLLSINDLTSENIYQLIQRANEFRHKGIHTSFPDAAVALLFHENSTRTRVSFELASKKLGMTVIRFDGETSSLTKGETLFDTFMNLYAMGLRYFVLRHQENGIHKAIATRLPADAHLINAGEGVVSHPSQALLDAMTMVNHYKDDLPSKKVVIVGNIRHSRVAKSLLEILPKIGVSKVSLVAPKIWQLESPAFGDQTESLREGLADADIIITLRIQKERLEKDALFSLEAYRKDFAITEESLRFAKPTAIIMHPGPVNRDIELDSSVLDGSQSLVLKQVENGVWMRAAIFHEMLF